MSAAKKLLLVLLAATNLTALANDGAPILPYRPSATAPAQLPEPGQLEFEIGTLSAKSDDQRRGSFPYQLKLALSPEWGVLLGGEAYVSSREGGSRATGMGDTAITLKRAFQMTETSAFGLELTSKIPTAKNTIGSGKADTMLNGIFSKDIDKVHIDLNLNATRIGVLNRGEGKTQTGLSTAVSMVLNDQWGVLGELAGTRRTGVANTAIFMTALTYSPSKRVTFDVGVAKGLNDASPDWAVFAGVVLPVTKFW